MTSTPRQPWKTTFNRLGIRKNGGTKPPFFYLVFYSNLDFMLKEIQHINGVKTKNEWIVTASKNNNNLQHYLAKLANDKPNAYNYSIHIDINPMKNTFKVSSLFLKRTQNFKDKDSAYNFITCLINLLFIRSYV